jgi:hypothetical protein
MRVTLALSVAAAVAALVPAAASAAGPSTIQVVSVTVKSTSKDKPPKGPSAGDTTVMRDRLVNAVAQYGRKKGAVVGSDSGTMRILSKTSARFDGIAHLPGGTLTLKGKIAAGPNQSILIPVTAGTGVYQGARGFVVVGPGTKRSLNVYHLTYNLSPVA